MLREKFNNQWEFQMGTKESLASSLMGSDIEEIILPHDASIGLSRDPNGTSGNGYFRTLNCQYRKKFILQEASDKCIYIEFEGVYQNAFVYVNDTFVGKHPYGYTKFLFDITSYVNLRGNNEIVVFIKNELPSGRWYTGTGIYRNVNLIIGDRLHFALGKTHLWTENIGDPAVIHVKTLLENTGIGVRKGTICAELLDDHAAIAASDVIPFVMLEHSANIYEQKLYVRDAHLWDTDNPYLYQYRILIRDENGDVIDEDSGNFGIRTLTLDPVHGMRINGQEIKLRGGCIHHDNGLVGTAEFFYPEMLKIQSLKEAGYNAVRSAHHPMSAVLLDICDKVGMLVMDEFSDVWVKTKVDFDYGMSMSDWWENDITSMVDNDFNHPCVIMYSVGNEIKEMGNQFDSQWGKKIADKIRMLDETRYTVNSVNITLSLSKKLPKILNELQDGEDKREIRKQDEINELMSDLGALMRKVVTDKRATCVLEEAASQVDILGYNYATARYEIDVHQYPNRILLGSECFPGELDENWKLVMKYPQIIGDFSWAAWDYLGEAGIGQITYGEEKLPGLYAGYPYKMANCGDFNILGDKMPVLYWRQIVWGIRRKPYIAVQHPKYYGQKLHMSDWRMTEAIRCWEYPDYEGWPVKVEVYSPVAEVELYINGRSVGREKCGLYKEYVAVFHTTYTKGCISAEIVDDGKHLWDHINSPEGKINMKVVGSVSKLPADGSDVAYVDLFLEGENGARVWYCETPVCVKIEGCGNIVGFGSANPKSEEDFFEKKAVAYEGHLRAVVRGNGKKGKISVFFHLEGTGTVSFELWAE